MTLIELIALSMATWRVSNLFVEEEGPYGMLDKIRHFIGVRYASEGTAYSDSEVGKLFICVWCISVWVGAVFTILHFVGWGWVSYPFALSALGIMVDQWLEHRNTHN